MCLVQLYSTVYGYSKPYTENSYIFFIAKKVESVPSFVVIIALLPDTHGAKLTKKLSEANQQNQLVEEIAQCGIPEGSRKINGKYIHSHLVARLEGILVFALTITHD
ncbi:hypothetical protein JHK82_024934 [Glycine max]|nr:hypothetical protein JHK82_024934 [Glycine max]